MNFCQSTCPACQNGIGFKPPKLGTVRLTCPKCKHQFLFEVVVEPAASDAFLEQLSTAPIQPSTRPTGFGNQQPGRYIRNKKSGVFVPVLLAILGTFGLGTVILIGAVVIYFSKRLSDESFAPQLGSGSISSVLPLGLGFDTLQRVQSDMEAECARIEAVGLTIAPNDQSPQKAVEFKASADKLLELTLRCCRLEPVPTPFEDLLILTEPFIPLTKEQRRELAAMNTEQKREYAHQLRQEYRSKPPEPHPFWREDGNAGDDRPVTKAITELTRSRASSYIALNVVIDLPSPFSREADHFNWTDEERVLVATTYLQGRLSRDFLRAFASVESPTPSQATLRAIHASIDKYTAEALELKKKITWQNRILVNIPKNNLYGIHQAMAQLTYLRIKPLLLARSTDPQLEFACKDYEKVLEAIDEFKFDSKFSFTNSSYDRYQDWLKEENRKREQALAQLDEQNRRADQQRADALQKERDLEKERLAAVERQRKSAEDRIAAEQNAEEERRRMLQDRLAAQNALADAQRNGAMGNPTGSGPPPGFGGPPQGFGGPPSGFGEPRPGMMGPRFQPPGPMETPNATNQNVIIEVPRVKSNDSMHYSQLLAKDLLKYNPSVNISNGVMKISLQRYNQPLATLRALLPFLIIERIDEKNRVVTAREAI